MAARRVEYQTRAVQDESGPRVRIMIAKPRADSGNSEEQSRLMDPAPRPGYKTAENVASNGMVTSAKTVVMKVPCAMVLASPPYW